MAGIKASSCKYACKVFLLSSLVVEFLFARPAPLIIYDPITFENWYEVVGKVTEGYLLIRLSWRA